MGHSSQIKASKVRSNEEMASTLEWASCMEHNHFRVDHMPDRKIKSHEITASVIKVGTNKFGDQAGETFAYSTWYLCFMLDVLTFYG